MLDFYNIFDNLGTIYFFFIFFFVFIAKINDWLDIKIYLKHERKFLTHSPLSPLLILISIIIGTFFTIYNIFFGIYIGFIIYIIFLLHFFLDLLNPSGVPLLPKTRLTLKLFSYDNLKWNLIFLFIGVTMIILAFLGFIICF